MAIVSTDPTPFEVVDPPTALAWLRARFPGVVAWYGEVTGRWWALIGGRLAEYGTFGELRDELVHRVRVARGTAAPPVSRTPAPRASAAPPRPRVRARAGWPRRFLGHLRRLRFAGAA